MKRITFRLSLGFAAALCVFVTGCGEAGEAGSSKGEAEGTRMGNPVVHFEIPVTNMDRAVEFYEAVFGYRLSRQEVDGYSMAFFPRNDGALGASGALASGEVYKPSKDGAIIYFDVEDIDAVLQRAQERGGSLLYSKKDIGEAGYVAEFEDSEGNRIALSQAKD